MSLQSKLDAYYLNSALQNRRWTGGGCHGAGPLGGYASYQYNDFAGPLGGQYGSRGGSFFGDIGNFFKGAAETVGNTIIPIVKSGLVSKGLALIPHAGAQAASEALKSIGAGMRRRRGARLRGGKGTYCQFAAARGNRWIQYVKYVAQNTGMSYSAALADPRTRAGYAQGRSSAGFTVAPRMYPRNRIPRQPCRLRARAIRYGLHPGSRPKSRCSPPRNAYTTAYPRQ